jgi:murein DD-endopeptidase MepM/ murein hydrolase activator NlpD
MAHRKPIYQAVPVASIQRRQHHRQVAALILAATAVATITYALAATAILRDTPVHAGAVNAEATATLQTGVTSGAGTFGGGLGGREGTDPPSLDSPAAQPPTAASDSAQGDSGRAAHRDAPGTSGNSGPEGLTGYRWPLQGGRISSFFEDRTDGFVVIDGRRVHDGLDIATYCGDDVIAAHAGTVLEAGRHFDRQIGYSLPPDAFYARLARRQQLGQLPIVVVIDDGNGYRSLYAHLEGVTVHPGKHVRAGQVIGYEGATGSATGCHLHYGMVRMDGAWLPVARELVRKERYPTMVRERIDPLRVLSLQMPWAPRMIPGINPPKVSPGLDRPTAR